MMIAVIIIMIIIEGEEQQQQQDKPTQTSKEIDDKENKLRLQLSVVWF
jgi:hypothetical protein